MKIGQELRTPPRENALSDRACHVRTHFQEAAGWNRFCAIRGKFLQNPPLGHLHWNLTVPNFNFGRVVLVWSNLDLFEKKSQKTIIWNGKKESSHVWEKASAGRRDFQRGPRVWPWAPSRKTWARWKVRPRRFPARPPPHAGDSRSPRPSLLVPKTHAPAAGCWGGGSVPPLPKKTSGWCPKAAL